MSAVSHQREYQGEKMSIQLAGSFTISFIYSGEKKRPRKDFLDEN